MSTLYFSQNKAKQGLKKEHASYQTFPGNEEKSHFISL
jgi:hypothetical protein